MGILKDIKPLSKLYKATEIIFAQQPLCSKEIIECIHNGVCDHQCTKAFKITEDEFLLHKKMNFVLPKMCFNCRHQLKLRQRNPLKLWHRQCMCDKKNHIHGAGKCQIEFETPYAPDRPEIVYCEKCYQQEVY